MLHGLTAAIVLKVHHFRGGRSCSGRLYNSVVVVVPSNEGANENEPSSIVSLFNPESGRVCHCVSNCLDAAVNSAAQPFQRTKNGRTTDSPGPEPPARRRGRTLSDQGTGAGDRGSRGGLLSPGKKEREKCSNGRRLQFESVVQKMGESLSAK